MILDRKLQNEILTKLSEVYPDELDIQDWQAKVPELRANLYYLLGHKLITGIESGAMVGNTLVFAKITVDGIDFLADDGGLSAILGVVTIKLHEDTLLRLIEARLESSNLAPAEKSGLMKSIRELPGDAIKHLTEKLIDAGLENWPAALPLIQRALGGLL